jgi:DnaJ-class molecular chaperone
MVQIFFGQRTRSEEVNKTIECPDCCGGKFALYEITEDTCERCYGRKEIKEWVKSFFGGEVEKNITCSRCDGSGRVENKSVSPYSGTW